MREKMLGLLDEYSAADDSEQTSCRECGYLWNPDPQHHPACSLGALRNEILTGLTSHGY